MSLAMILLIMMVIGLWWMMLDLMEMGPADWMLVLEISSPRLVQVLVFLGSLILIRPTSLSLTRWD